MLITYGHAFVVQLLLLCSVYVIYFQSTILTGLEPQKTLLKYAPADRLVVFVIDDLSAKAFFEQRCRNVPQLKKIFLHQGQVGINRMRVASKCRSAHLTLFSGRYEDYLAGLQGIASDTIFNRSTRSFAWGSAELLQHFPAVHEVYTHPPDIPGLGISSYKLDEWAFQAVRNFLRYKASKLQQLQGVVFFVQLLSLREATGFRMYQEQLIYTQRRIWTIYQRFERAFPDQRTAYLLTSDHGRPEKGYSNGSSDQDLETPFVIWGAGVAHITAGPGRSFVANELGQRLPLHILESIQLTPLMSGLLGLPTPVHNRGQLYAGLLNASMHEAHATYNNAQQLLNQAQRVLSQHRRGLLANLMPSHWLNEQLLKSYLNNANLLWRQQRFLTLTEYSGNLMPTVLQCIDYYVHYYRRGLLLASACAFLGWLLQLCGVPTASWGSLQLLLCRALLRLVMLLLLLFVLLQRVPWLTSGLLLLPPLLWARAMETNVEYRLSRHQLLSMLLALCCVVGFFFRRFIALVYLGFACYHNRCAIVQCSRSAYLWLFHVCALTALSWLPPALGYWQRNWLLVSLLITFARPFVCRSLHWASALHRRSLICNGLVLLTAALHVLFSSQARMLHLIARAYACYVFYPYYRQQGLEVVVYNLSTLYTLICTSYESLVIQLLAMELQLALRLKQEHGAGIERKSTLAMYMLLYSCYSLFVIGNIKAVDRFRFYMRFANFGCYSMLVNGALIALKLLLPVLLLLCIICANCEIAWPYRQEIFRRLLIMCNVMALVFLFHVRSGYIWWEDLVRFLHFSFVQALPFLLLLLCYLAHFMLGEHTMETPQLPKWNVHIY
ncbi:GPI ethanolamine phosphate transferase 1 [Drosophila montana]|uniref:GPI ethanolamine phosphate transferase 1 n=1 Tax=Drosophila montana TaxID=40370 RepID=UPI00313A7F77